MQRKLFEVVERLADNLDGNRLALRDEGQQQRMIGEMVQTTRHTVGRFCQKGQRFVGEDVFRAHAAEIQVGSQVFQ